MNNKFTTYKDLKNNREFKLPKFNGISNKNLDWLFQDRNYSKIFNSKNTILIDDNPYNNVIIPLNNIYVPRYCCKNNDSILFDLYLWFKKIKILKIFKKQKK